VYGDTVEDFSSCLRIAARVPESPEGGSPKSVLNFWAVGRDLGLRSRLSHHFTHQNRGRYIRVVLEIGSDFVPVRSNCLLVFFKALHIEGSDGDIEIGRATCRE